MSEVRSESVGSPLLAASARLWVSNHRSPIAEVSPLRSSQGDVWRVTLADGSRLVVKRASRAAIDRECWGLEVARGVGSVPGLLSRPAPEVVVLRWHEGEPSTEAEAVRAAGVWLRRLHGVEATLDDPLPVRDAIARRRDAWLERAQGHLTADTRDRLRAAIDPAVFEGLQRVPCHRDFTPTNWLWHEVLTVIDFGQSRPDVSLWDLVKLEADTFPEHPDLRDVFFDGYGALTEQDETRLAQLVLLHGLQTAVWGDAHGDAGFSALGRRILERRLA